MNATAKVRLGECQLQGETNQANTTSKWYDDRSFTRVQQGPGIKLVVLDVCRSIRQKIWYGNTFYMNRKEVVFTLVTRIDRGSCDFDAFLLFGLRSLV